ncbi:MAG: VirB4 family type IV secretion system protein [Acidimicrobiales bacterium]
MDAPAVQGTQVARQMRPPLSHRATTAHLQSVYPFVSGGGLDAGGPLIGRDLLGGPFRFDPWELYARGIITNPNVLVVGQIGRGKSSFVKTFVSRQLGRGRQAWIVDPKGEYGVLAEAFGCQPVLLRPGGPTRINPLDVPSGARHEPAGDNVEAAVKPRLELACALLCSSLARPLGPEERTAVELAVRQVSVLSPKPTLVDLVEAMLFPEPAAARSLGYESTSLAELSRTVALELRRMVMGDLAGMFDGATAKGVGIDGRLVVIDLSATFSSPALPLIMACATAWLQAAFSACETVKRLVVLDEAWAILSDIATARWSQATFKLSRALGVSNLVVLHRLSDLGALGVEGSTQSKLGDGLLADSETRVCFAQSPSEIPATAGLIGLNSTESDALGRLPRGVALWKVGHRTFLVEHLVSKAERSMIDTDAALR